jgi:hypothetical protein
MNAFFVALLFSIGTATWVYTKLQQRTGYGNSKAAFKGAAVAGGMAFIVFLTIGLTLF